MHHDLTIVLPAFNEESAICDTIFEIIHKTQAFIVVVDDGSTDDSPTRLGNVADGNRIRVVRHSARRGYGAALKTGISLATSSLVALMDADYTYDAGCLNELSRLAQKQKMDCVWCDRIAGGGRGMSAPRRIGNTLINATFRLTTGKSLPDCISGQRIFTREALMKLDYMSLPDGFDFMSALSKRIVSRGLRYATIPWDYRERKGVSKLNPIIDFIRILRPILTEK